MSQLAPEEAVTVEGARIRLDLARVPHLRTRASSVAVVAPDRGLNLLLIHSRDGQWVAMNRACTHGGAMCTYNANRQTVRCTSLNHAEYDLGGTLLHGRTHGNLRTYPVRVSGATLEIQVEAAANV